MNKAEKELRALRQEEEVQVYKRLLSWIGAAALLEAFVLFGNRYYFHFLTTEIGFLKSLIKVFGALQYVGIVLGIACLAWAVSENKKDGKRFFPKILAYIFFVTALICTLFLHAGSISVPLLLAGIPTIATLTIVYYIYQKEFFIVVCITTIGILGFWLLRALGVHRVHYFYAYLLLAYCVIAAAVYFSLNLKKNAGNYVWKEKIVSVLKSDANYNSIWVTCAAVAFLLPLSLFLGATFAYYALLCFMVWIFVMAVYFTSRLM